MKTFFEKHLGDVADAIIFGATLGILDYDLRRIGFYERIVTEVKDYREFREVKRAQREMETL